MWRPPIKYPVSHNGTMLDRVSIAPIQRSPEALMCHLSSRRFLLYFLCPFIVVLAFVQRGTCQSGRDHRSGTSASVVQLWATKDDLTLTVPLVQPIEKAVHA